MQKFIVNQPTAVARAVDGENAMGTVDKPEVALKNFKKRFGVKEVDGKIVFENVCPGDEENAREIYEILTNAVKGDTTPIKASVGKSLGTIKAFEFTDSDGTPSKKYDLKQMADFILNKAAGIIGTSVKDVRARLGKVKASTSKAGSGRAKQSQTGSSLTVRVQGRKFLEDNNLVAFVNDILNGVEPAPNGGFKSEISAKYKSSKMDAKGQPKQITYKIPLVVMQHKLGENPEYAEFKSQGLVSRNQTVDISSDEELDKFLGQMANIVAEVAVSSDDNKMEFISKITEEVNKQKENASKSAADEMDI
jgi:hypothetical protein